MAIATPLTRLVIVPGCGCSPVKSTNWYKHMEQYLVKNHKELFDEIVLEDMPDPIMAHENIWLPFLKDTLNANENTIIVGQVVV